MGDDQEATTPARFTLSERISWMGQHANRRMTTVQLREAPDQALERITANLWFPHPDHPAPEDGTSLPGQGATVSGTVFNVEDPPGAVGFRLRANLPQDRFTGTLHKLGFGRDLLAPDLPELVGTISPAGEGSSLSYRVDSFWRTMNIIVFSSLGLLMYVLGVILLFVLSSADMGLAYFFLVWGFLVFCFGLFPFHEMPLVMTHEKYLQDWAQSTIVGQPARESSPEPA